MGEVSRVGSGEKIMNPTINPKIKMILNGYVDSVNELAELIKRAETYNLTELGNIYLCSARGLISEFSNPCQPYELPTQTDILKMIARIKWVIKIENKDNR